MMKFISILLILLPFYAFAQDSNQVVLSYSTYINIVINEHPYAKQANIKISEGDAKLLYAKGAFDPKIYTDVNQKYFKDNQYYSQINGGLKIPTWFGIELKGGYEQNQGQYLNPENTTPGNGLLYAGISMPIGRGLLIDKRRAELKKAKLYQQVTEFEKRLILNKLIYEAGTIYWKWFKSYNTLLVYKNGYKLANERLNAVKKGVALGDRPAIDTLEASIQLQNRLLNLQQADVEFKNNSALVSIYLWAEGAVPLELQEGTIPISSNKIQILKAKNIFLLTIDSLISQHPKLNQSRVTIKQLEIDARLKRNQLLPELNIKYNPITEYTSNNLFANYSVNDYTWGMQFQMPIFLRKERGALKLTQLKIQEYNLQLINNQEVLRYKVIAAWNQLNTTVKQIDLYKQTVENSKILLAGERKLFNIGESSLFMVNSREVSYIKTQLKFIELLIKNRNAELALKYALGQSN